LRPYLNKTLHKKGLAGWLKEYTLTLSPSSAKKRERNEEHTNKQAQLLSRREAVAITPKWQRLEGISCIKQRVLLLRPGCDSPLPKNFSLARDPEPTPWDLSSKRSDPLLARVQKPNN
jgi:hypothetical protein